MKIADEMPWKLRYVPVNRKGVLICHLWEDQEAEATEEDPE